MEVRAWPLCKEQICTSSCVFSVIFYDSYNSREVLNTRRNDSILDDSGSIT